MSVACGCDGTIGCDDMPREMTRGRHSLREATRGVTSVKLV